MGLIISGLLWAKNNWKLVLAGLVVLGLFASHAWAYGAGVDAEENRIARQRLAAFEASYEQSMRVVSELLKETREIDATTQIVEREIIKHVPDDRACDLGADVIGLLNQASGYAVPAPGGTPPAQ